jgi:hypothetical protein
VQEAVQHGAGQGAVVVEDFRPVFIGLVGRDDGRSGRSVCNRNSLRGWSGLALTERTSPRANPLLKFGRQEIGPISKDLFFIRKPAKHGRAARKQYQQKLLSVIRFWQKPTIYCR